MTIDKKQVERIVEKVLEELSISDQITSPNNPTGVADSVFQEMEDAIQAAVVAHH